MKREWRFLVIDVDYHPCDPGSTKWFCERTRYRKADLQAGRALRYEDPSGLLAEDDARDDDGRWDAYA